MIFFKFILLNSFFFCVLFTGITYPICLFSNDLGRVIAFSGLSGCGKTTMAKELKRLCACSILVEPEESEWPDVILKKDTFGAFYYVDGIPPIMATSAI